MTLALEVCVECGDLQSVRHSVTNALAGGAQRVELCRDMAADGLTPDVRDIKAARQIFGDRRGVLAMIRPRGGDFCYNSLDIACMAQQIALVASAGADGIVMGALKDGQIDEPALDQLLAIARDHSLSVTFHRAFDDVIDKPKALQLLIDKKVQYVLTCGAALSTGISALDGVEDINRTIEQARGRIEIIVGGGIDCDNLPLLLAQLKGTESSVSVHSYSGLLVAGLTSASLVKVMAQDLHLTDSSLLLIPPH